MADANLTSDVEPDVTPAAASLTQGEGLVVAKAHGFFEVALAGSTYLCTLRGRLRKPKPLASPLPRQSSHPRPVRARPSSFAPIHAPSTSDDRPVIVSPGDHVQITVMPSGEGVIEDVLPRRTVLSRTRPEVGGEQIMLANLDLAVLAFAVQEPALDCWLLDRYLVICEHAQVPALICLNKVDLGVPAEVEGAERLYSSLGYPIIHTSATTGAGLADLRARLICQVSLLTGPSGVGKSSLMNALLADAGQRTGEISMATGKGRHTTSGARLLPLPDGGWLADSAGIRELTPWNVPGESLAQCFPELGPIADECAYEDCAHDEDDEGCALRAALVEGRITPERFKSFTRLLAMARTAEEPAWAHPLR